MTINPHTYIAPPRGDVLLYCGNERLRTVIGAIATSVGASLVTYNPVNRPTHGQWATAPLVLVSADTIDDSYNFARRSDIIVVSDDLDDASIWRKAVQAGGEHVVQLPDGQRWLEDRLASTVDDDPRCRFCGLSETHETHNPLAYAQDRYAQANAAVQAASKLAGEAALDVLRVIAEQENSEARFLGFTYSMEYFGHGQGGPLIHDISIYDENGVPLVLTTTDTNGVIEPTLDDSGMLQAYVNLVAYDLETDDHAEYALDLLSGAVHTEPPVTLQERPDEDDEE